MNQYIRTQMLLGEEAMKLLWNSHVAVFGIGGVGSYAAEALARSGIGTITLIDGDCVSESNLNRQSIAFHSTIGCKKVEVMEQKIHDINPMIQVHSIYGLYTPEKRESFFKDYTYILDCIDLVTDKLDLIEQAINRNIPILSALGTGNKLDPSLLQITDISKTQYCPFARVIRKELKARNITHTKVIYSPEVEKTESAEAPPPGRRSVPASTAWVPSVAGLMMAGECILDITHQGGASHC